jgi:hypothetical protein
MGMAHAWGLANVWFRNAQHGDPFGQQEIERGGVGAARPINAQIGILLDVAVRLSRHLLILPCHDMFHPGL